MEWTMVLSQVKTATKIGAFRNSFVFSFLLPILKLMKVKVGPMEDQLQKLVDRKQ